MSFAPLAVASNVEPAHPPAIDIEDLFAAADDDSGFEDECVAELKRTVTKANFDICARLLSEAHPYIAEKIANIVTFVNIGDKKDAVVITFEPNKQMLSVAWAKWLRKCTTSGIDSSRPLRQDYRNKVKKFEAHQARNGLRLENDGLPRPLLLGVTLDWSEYSMPLFDEIATDAVALETSYFATLDEIRDRSASLPCRPAQNPSKRVHLLALVSPSSPPQKRLLALMYCGGLHEGVAYDGGRPVVMLLDEDDPGADENDDGPSDAEESGDDAVAGDTTAPRAT
jgi:hypothetical protein